MRIGIPAEVKDNERRVSLTPAGARELSRAGHQVLVQHGAGAGAGFGDEDYVAHGAVIVGEAQQAWDAELVVKVKEPIPSEYDFLREGLTLFTYLHLAADEPLTSRLLSSGTTSIAYETVRAADGSLPLLAPMSEIAGRLSSLVGAYHLMSAHGGRGVLPGGVAGTRPARVSVIGGGVAGEHAAANALGLGAQVTLVDVSLPRLRALDVRFGGRAATLVSTESAIADLVGESDLVIGAALIPGARAPKLVTQQMVATMRPGSVLVDIAIDQGGCFEGSHPTTHRDPVFPVHNALYYCVANMPGAVAETSTMALTNATLPYVLRLADAGWRVAVADDPVLAGGLTTHGGTLFNAAVAEAFGLTAVEAPAIAAR
ncbi:MAG: alanine dehydrogenase [Bifidobacteriaceae bacterium]|jgi:alanine dehydrogenase|nr:alanine dehydrogenase [Bifidobacteriaceae bacterium]